MKTTKSGAALIVLALVLGLAACQGDANTKIELPVKSAQAGSGPAVGSAAVEGSAAVKDRAPAAAGSAPSATAGVASGATGSRAAASGERRFAGSFEPRRVTDVAATVPGIVRGVYVDEGDRVEKGARLVNIDGEDYALRVAQAAAGLKAAETAVATIQVEYDRALRLRDQDAMPASAVDQLGGQLAGAQAQVEVARVGLRMAQKARNDALVRAPYDGVVTAVNVAEGTFAGPGPGGLVRLEEVGTLYLRVHVPEEFTRRVTVGSPLSARVPALDKTINLTVSRINPTISGRSRAFDVLAEVDNTSFEIQPGMFAEVTLGGARAGGSPANEGEEQ